MQFVLIKKFDLNGKKLIFLLFSMLFQKKATVKGANLCDFA